MAVESVGSVIYIYMLEDMPSNKLFDAALSAIPWGYQSRTL